MKNSIALLVGNDINNLQPNNSWADLLNSIIDFCGLKKSAIHTENKPFPLLYEEIFLNAIRKKYRYELDLKKLISDKVSNIKQNEIHQRIARLPIAHIITTNYEFSLEGEVPSKNNGLITEQKYSVFRHYIVNKKNYWHIHGDCKHPASINLGFEHYGGQLQQIRNYTASGTVYSNKTYDQSPFTVKMKKNKINHDSWIDLFFTHDIFILGLGLDFVETDLWWLLTFRARQLFYLKNKVIKNNIFYFIPKEYLLKSSNKIDLLKANGVQIIDAFSCEPSKADYYHQVMSYIEEKTLR